MKRALLQTTLTPVLFATVIMLNAGARMASAAPGDLDPTFGVGGKVTTGFGSTSLDFAKASARDGNGNLYLAGASNSAGNYDFAIVKLDASGQPVASFGNGGRLAIDFGSGRVDIANAIAVIGSNIYVAGTSTSLGNADMAIAKLDLNGQLVASFGNAGKQVIDLAGNNEHANAVAVAANGNIYLAGDSYPSQLSDSDFTVIRLTASGTLDAGYGSGGIVRIDFAGQGDIAYALLLDGGENLYVGGSARYATGTMIDMALAKLDATGNAVTGFGTAGKTSIDFATIDNGLALAGDVAGSFYLAGSTEIPAGHLIMAVAKVDANGMPVSSFGSNGKATLDPSASSEARAVAIDADGNVYLAGSASRPAPSFVDIIVAELDLHGSLVPTFGNGGVQPVDFAGNNDAGFSLLLEASGRLVASGNATIAGAGLDFAAARLLTAPTNRLFASGFDPQL